MKRKKKKALKERKKLNERLNLKMVLKGDDGPTMEGDELFSIKMIKDKTDMVKLIDQAPDVVAESEDENECEIKRKYIRYDKDQSSLDSSGLYYKDSESELEIESDDEDGEKIEEGLGLTGSESETEELESKEEKKGNKIKKEKEHPLITDLDYRDKDKKKAHKAELWFERDVFRDLIGERDEDVDLDKMVEEYKKKGAKIIGEDSKIVRINEKDKVLRKSNFFEDTSSKSKQGKKEVPSDSDFSSDSESEDSDYDIEQEIHKTTNNSKKDGFEVVKTEVIRGKKKLSEEELALGTLMVNSKKMKRDLIDGAWNRYAFNDDNLPSWFKEDEEKHMKKDAPVPKVS